MSPYRIAVIRGSAPGADAAVDMAMAALRHLGLDVETYEQDLGEARYLRSGELLTARAVEEMRTMDAIYCGSPPWSQDPRVAPGTLERGLLFALRRELSLQINVRSFRDLRADVSLTVVRENSEGAYFNEGTTVASGSEAETAIELATTTYAAARRCMRYAAECASLSRGRLVLAHKAKVLLASGRIWERALVDVAADYPHVTIDSENVDTVCARMIVDPGRYDVVVSDNVFGDIVSDVACSATQATMYACSAELSGVAGPSLFEPMHGAQGATPEPVHLLGALAAAGSLASHLGQTSVGTALQETACAGAANSIQGHCEVLQDQLFAVAEARLAAAQSRVGVNR